MERAVQIFAAVSFLVIGISHLVQRSAWIEFFAALRGLGRPGAFAEGFLCLSFGTVIVSFYDVWTGPGVVLTLIGWAQIAKALLRFAAPAASLRIYLRMTPERAWQIQVAGGFALVLSAFSFFLALRQTAP